MLESIDPDYVEWKGSVELQMSCQGGYDWPLNKPEHGVFRCKPDGLSWDPPIFPDCNTLLHPTLLTAQFTITLPFQECSALTTPSVTKRGVKFLSNKGDLLFEICPARTLLENCKIRVAQTVCNSPKSSPGMTRKSAGPHILLKAEMGGVKPAWSASDLIQTVKDVEKTISQLVQKRLGVNSVAKSRLGAVCQRGSIGAVRSGTEFVCRGCPLGHFLDRKSKTCKLCSPGYYNDKPLQESCTVCPVLKDIKNKSILKQVRKLATDGAYSISMCPYLMINADGNVSIVDLDSSAGRDMQPSGVNSVNLKGRKRRRKLVRGDCRSREGRMGIGSPMWKLNVHFIPVKTYCKVSLQP
ncbi:fibropellin-1 [Plakobranchus ocellatus]|uniref:Fibropellin-1 n=1 Tax=Plakobranchus ocellatus TaxID=259542 RepID=A0AAV3YNI0_9GAST|nr:fibropellin-1 [Plakobranchus ocellatus]